MGVKVLGTKYTFWRERKIPGTIGTKREKYSGVNAPIVTNFPPRPLINDAPIQQMSINSVFKENVLF